METGEPSHLISISGPQVGLLDPTQPTRVLSTPESALSFATFHPLAASSTTRTLSEKDDLCSAKRIVVETLRTGESFWRFVPRAKGVEIGKDEGSWPRVINICGQLVQCSQDQWDIYKLDPEYECTFSPAPEISSITRREPTSTSTSVEEASSEYTEHKRRVDIEPAEDSSSQPPSKRRRAFVEEVVTEGDDAEQDSDSEEDAVEDLIANDGMPGAWKIKRERIRKFRQALNEDKKPKRPKPAPRVEKRQSLKEASDISMIDLTEDVEEPSVSTQSSGVASQSSTAYSQSSTACSQPSSAAYSQTSQSSTAFSQTSTAFSSTSHNSGPFTSNSSQYSEQSVKLSSKRKTASPSPPRGLRAKRFHGDRNPEFARKKLERQRQRIGKVMERSEKKKDMQRKAFLDELYASAQSAFTPRHSHSSTSAEYATPPETQIPRSREPSNVASDPISLEEKMRRMREFEAFEKAQRKHDEDKLRAERAEAERRREQEEHDIREKLKAERLRQEREAERIKRKKQLEEEERRRKQAQEEAARRKRAEQQQNRWAQGDWTVRRALERYRVLSEAFDAAQFTAENPVTFETVPWPVLHRPSQIDVEIVQWSTVEDFFKAVRPHMNRADYKQLVEKSHRRFHPDRWSSRRVLQSTADEVLRSHLQVAVKAVAQALSPIWTEVKSM